MSSDIGREAAFRIIDRAFEEYVRRPLDPAALRADEPPVWAGMKGTAADALMQARGALGAALLVVLFATVGLLTAVVVAILVVVHVRGGNTNPVLVGFAVVALVLVGGVTVFGLAQPLVMLGGARSPSRAARVAVLYAVVESRQASGYRHLSEWLFGDDAELARLSFQGLYEVGRLDPHLPALLDRHPKRLISWLADMHDPTHLALYYRAVHKHPSAEGEANYLVLCAVYGNADVLPDLVHMLDAGAQPRRDVLAVIEAVVARRWKAADPRHLAAVAARLRRPVEQVVHRVRHELKQRTVYYGDGPGNPTYHCRVLEFYNQGVVNFGNNEPADYYHAPDFDRQVAEAVVEVVDATRVRQLAEQALARVSAR